MCVPTPPARSPKEAVGATPTAGRNTIYMDAALDQVRTDGHEVRDEDVALLSPPGYDHINMLG
jgi:hypothetical protein